MRAFLSIACFAMQRDLLGRFKQVKLLRAKSKSILNAFLSAPNVALKDRKENPNDWIEKEAAKREITVWFEGNVVDGMEWSFEPIQRSIKVRQSSSNDFWKDCRLQVHPGQSALAFYKATNHSDKAITGISTYNVTPNQTGNYFNKIQCFCFENQLLRPGESVDMPVFFYIDPEFAVDRKMKKINDITLSYTFFKVVEDS